MSGAEGAGRLAAGLGQCASLGEEGDEQEAVGAPTPPSNAKRCRPMHERTVRPSGLAWVRKAVPFLENAVRDAITYAERAGRMPETVTAMDVMYALRREGRTLYSFGG